MQTKGLPHLWRESFLSKGKISRLPTGSLLAMPQEGFELSTSALGEPRSIRLSYWGVMEKL